MSKLIRENIYFLVPATLFILIGIILLSIYPKGIIHIEINEAHNKFFDWFYSYITFFGNGWMILIVLIILLFVKYRYALILMISNILITIVVQVSKHFIFPDSLRPKAYFEGIYELYLVEGIAVHSYHSFPSGHAATAFSIFMMLALITRNKVWSLFWFLFGILTAFSRVYLSQHFLEDIIAGSLIGYSLTFFTYFYFNKFVPERLEKSLTDLIITWKSRND